MGLWDIFSTKSNGIPATAKNTKGTDMSKMRLETARLLPNASENQLIRTACVAGIMSQVAWSDMELKKSEVEHMKKALGKWTDLAEDDVEAVVELAVAHVKELAGIENYKYTDSLSKVMETNQRFGLLKALFALAAADGSVAEKEAEEIRLVCKGLLLEHKHFISARATVLEHLAALKKD